MLYVKFDIININKFTDFKRLFSHMVAARQPNYKPEELNEEIEIEVEVDFSTMSSEEITAYFIADLEDALDEYIQTKRYKKMIPTYAFSFLEEYIAFENKTTGVYGFHLEGLFTYLENDFEVDLDALKKVDSEGIIEFSSGNYPFGGLERFMMTLKAFDLIPKECFNGFEVLNISWKSKFVCATESLPKKTKEYLSN